MTVYKLSTARLDMWKAWLTLNGIPTREVVRDSKVRIRDGATIEVTEFAVDTSGKRILHTCECDGAHLAKRQNTYDLLETPGAWAATDLVSA